MCAFQFRIIKHSGQFGEGASIFISTGEFQKTRQIESFWNYGKFRFIGWAENHNSKIQKRWPNCKNEIWLLFDKLFENTSTLDFEYYCISTFLSAGAADADVVLVVELRRDFKRSGRNEEPLTREVQTCFCFYRCITQFETPTVKVNGK